MMFDEAFRGVYTNWMNAASETQKKQQDFEAADEMRDAAKAARDSAIAIEDAAFSALLQFRDDVLDGGWHEVTPPTEAPAETPVPIPAAPEVIVEAENPMDSTPAPVDMPASEVPPMASEPAAPVEAEMPEAPVSDPVVETPIEEVPMEEPVAEAPATPGGLELPSMTDDSLVAKLPVAEFNNDEF